MLEEISRQIKRRAICALGNFATLAGDQALLKPKVEKI